VNVKRAIAAGAMGLSLAFGSTSPADAQSLDGKAYWPNPAMGAAGRYLYALTLGRPFWRFVSRSENWDVFSLVSADGCEHDDYAWILLGGADERLAVFRGSNYCTGVSITNNPPLFTVPRFIDDALLPLTVTGQFGWSATRTDTQEQIDHGITRFVSVISREFVFGQWTYKVRIDTSDQRGDGYEILWMGDVRFCEDAGKSAPGLVAYQNKAPLTTPVEFCWHAPGE
jgi:hypothetical protein